MAIPARRDCPDASGLEPGADDRGDSFPLLRVLFLASLLHFLPREFRHFVTLLGTHHVTEPQPDDVGRTA